MIFCDASSRTQYFSISTSLSLPLRRFCPLSFCILNAFSTSSCIFTEEISPLSSLCTSCMTTKRSIRSKNGSESLFWYLFISTSEQRHTFIFDNRFPQGQGFCAATNIMSASYSILALTLAMCTFLSCRGSRRASKTFLEK